MNDMLRPPPRLEDLATPAQEALGIQAWLRFDIQHGVDVVDGYIQTPITSQPQWLDGTAAGYESRVRATVLRGAEEATEDVVEWLRICAAERAAERRKTIEEAAASGWIEVVDAPNP